MLTSLHVRLSLLLALGPSAVAPVGYSVCRSVQLSPIT